MLIGIDLDDVLADFITYLIEFHNQTYGTKLAKDEFNYYEFWEIWGGTRKEAIQKVYNFHNTSFFTNIKPTLGSIESINTLKKDNELVIITSRQNSVIKPTREWVNQHFPNCFSEIYFTNHYSLAGQQIKKSTICSTLSVDILVEDSLVYALDCLSKEREVILIDQPWNQQEILPKGISRVKSWEEVVNLITTYHKT